MSRYEMNIVYICGEDNCVVDALLCIPEGAFPDEQPTKATPPAPYFAWKLHIGVVLSIFMDQSVLKTIKNGYETDDFCLHLAQNATPGAHLINGLWYIGDCLVIPRTGDICKNLFHLAYDTLGHFGADKCYMSLCDAYCWPNMQMDLEKSYVPLCSDCQWNKSQTTKAPSPLHPLPIPDEHCDSVALNFVGPLSEDEGYNCLLTMTDHLGSDYRLILTRTDASAEDVALMVFNNWYCKNGLLSNFVSDCDKLFVSCFWKALTKLAGIKPKMSSTYHLETNGFSKCTNKTVN